MSIVATVIVPLQYFLSFIQHANLVPGSSTVRLTFQSRVRSGYKITSIHNTYVGKGKRNIPYTNQGLKRVFVSIKSLELYNFTTLGATGRIGPNSNAGYSGTGLQDVDVKDGVQEWQVPITGKYSVEACGASGGDGFTGKKGGRGAKVSGVLTLAKGDKLVVLVGQRGSTKDGGRCGSGGGGTFVFFLPSSSVPILVAGGGGGGGPHNGLPGNDQPDGSGSAAGSSGAGGLVCQPDDRSFFADSGSGAGYIGEGGCGKSGSNCLKIACAKGGGSFAKNFKGGEGAIGYEGGLGGGGACANFPGGGGGYSGGGVASDMVAGGGGSYKPDHTWSVVKGSCHEGDGYVSFIIED